MRCCIRERGVGGGGGVVVSEIVIELERVVDCGW